MAVRGIFFSREEGVVSIPNTLHCPPELLKDTTEVLTWLHAPQTEELKKLTEVWKAYQPEGMVYTRDIPSREVAHLLSHIIIWEPVAGWTDARVRLMGSGLYFRFGGDVKGQLMSELFPVKEAPHHFEMLHSAMTKQQPMFIRSVMKSGAVEVMTLDLVVLPIHDADGKSPLALVCVRPCA